MFRGTEKNIGVAPDQIGTKLRNLLDDTRYWLAHSTHPLDESAARFHHRLGSIHCFANGNGRHARLLTDLVLEKQGAAPFTWARSGLIHAGTARDRYLAALRAADARDYSLLLAFVRS